MARIDSFRERLVWQKAMALVESCYRLTGAFSPQERFGLTSELRWTAVSIPSNVAEGHNRRSRLAFRNHVAIALGSQAELETQLGIAISLRFGSSELNQQALRATAEVGRLLHGLVRSLERSPADP